MCDDLIQDAACVSMDQCLNCSRYEPILGQFYELTDSKHKPGMAQIYDDVQASLQTKEDFVKLNQIDTYSETPEIPECDLSKLHIKEEDDKDYDELLKEANNFVMDWTEVPFHKQSPHINMYEYKPYDLYADKMNILKNPYEDGFNAVNQLKFNRPNYGINSVGNGNFQISSFGGGFKEYYSMNDYDCSPDDKRLMIIKYAQEAIDLGKQGKFLYTFGAKIKTDYWKYTPNQLYDFVVKGEVINTFGEGRGNDDPNHKAVYVDCSSFASYIYGLCGLLTEPFWTSRLPELQEFDSILDPNQTVLENIKQAYPGDLLLYPGHVAIYAGLDQEFEASTDKAPNDKQVVLNKIRNKQSFKGIYRHKLLSIPKLKSVMPAKINVTLDEFTEFEKGKNVGRDTNNDGYVDFVEDGDILTDMTILKNYIDPEQRLTPELKMQFISIRNEAPPGVITVQMLNDYLAVKSKKRVKGIKVDSNYNPVYDQDGQLVWEEKYQFPRGDVWIAAAEKSGLSPLFLIAHCAGETGYCSVSNFTNYSKNFQASDNVNHLFNAYGLWCYDDEYFPNDPVLHRKSAKKECEARKWFSLEKSIVEGAIFIADRYLGQEAVNKYGRRDTAYFMKWHFGNLLEGQEDLVDDKGRGIHCSMQYATDVTWADQRAVMLYKMLEYSPIGREQALQAFTYHMPQFKK